MIRTLKHWKVTRTFTDTRTSVTVQATDPVAAAFRAGEPVAGVPRQRPDGALVFMSAEPVDEFGPTVVVEETDETGWPLSAVRALTAYKPGAEFAPNH